MTKRAKPRFAFPTACSKHASLSFGTTDTENMHIQGDNLEALKVLLPYYAGQVKCIYIDPPCNTRSAIEHYDNKLEHATWHLAEYDVRAS